MKSIKDLREDYNLVTEKEEHDMNKLTQLVRAGLFDAKKLSALKRAMDKPADKMTAQEKRMMINLLDSLMAEVLSDKQVYRKIKQDVMKEAKSWETKDYLSKNDPRFGRGFPDQKDMPSVLLLKRKGIRVFPDGQKIGLYYAQAIDKYVSIPFQDINISGHSVHEETQLNELGLRDIVGGIADFLGSGNDGESKKEEPKYLKPGEAGKTKLNVGGPKEKEDDNDRPDATRSRMNSLNRQATQTMAKSARDERNVRESFMDKLEVLREGAAPRPPKGYVAPKIRAKAGIGPGNKLAPEKSPWEKLTDIKDDGTAKGLVKDVMPVVGTVRQAKRTSAAYDQATSEFKKGNYWNATKAAADTALQGGLTGLSAVGDVATVTGIAAPVVSAAKGAVNAARIAKTSKNVNKFIATSKTIPVKRAPALPAPAAPEASGPKANISKSQANKIRNNTAADIAITKQTNVAAAGHEAQAFREKYPRAKADDKNAGVKTVTKPKSNEPKFELPKAGAADRSSGARVATKAKSDFKLAEPPTSKGELVTVNPTPKVSSAAPKETTSGKSTLSYGKWPVPEPKAKQSSSTSTSTEVNPAPQAKQQSQDKPQTQTQTKPKKTEPDEPTSTKTKEKEKVPRGPGLAALLPSLALGGVKGKPLTPGPAKLSLNLSAPKREGDPSAIASRQSSLEREMLKAQSRLRESVDLDGNLFELNSKEAKKVTALYESLNTKNKKKMVEMMNEGAESLEKVISFAVRQ